MKKIRKTFALGLVLSGITLSAQAQVLINEFDTNTSSAEYIELYNAGGSPVDLGAGGYVLVFINGNDNLTYQATDLTGSIAAGGFYLVTETGVATVNGEASDLQASWSSFQNGQDAIALLSSASASDYPNDVDYSDTLAANSDVQEDAVIYGSADVELEGELGFASGLFVPNGSGGSTERISDGQGGTGYSASDWQIDTRTPRTTNAAVILPTNVANIAAARLESVGTEVIITGTVTASNNENGLNTGRNQFFVQDGSGGDGQSGILVDDSSNTISATIAAGDTLTSLQGTLSTFAGMLQLVPTQDVVPVTGGSAPTPLVVTGAVTDFETIESELIQLDGVSITGAGNFDSGSSGMDYAITESPETIITILRVEEGSTLVGEAIPGSPATVIGVATEFSGALQIQPRIPADVSVASSVSDWMTFE